jgi:hypothetical protein
MFRLVMNVFLLLMMFPSAPAWTQEADVADLAARIAEHQDGKVWLTFPAREGVCGDGETYISTDGGERHFCGHWSSNSSRRECEAGPVRLVLKVRDSQVVKVKAYVGGDWPEPTPDILNLGELPAQAAADYLLELARTGSRQAAEAAIFPATLARDVVVWPALLDLARDTGRPQDVREQAVFWLSQVASEKATAGLTAIVADDDEDLELREHAIFALTQRGDEVSVPVLSRIARTSQHPQLRESALFWLAQSDDPRVLELFEEILLQE